MSRLKSLETVCIMLLVLGAPVTWAQESSQETDPGLASSPAPDLPPDQLPNQLPEQPLDRIFEQLPERSAEPQDLSLQRGYDELAAGFESKEDGNLVRASLHFQKALATSLRGSGVYWAALEELTFRLPLEQVRGLVKNEQWRKVDKLLSDLIERHKGDEDKSRFLLRLLTSLQQRAPERSTGPADGGEAISRIQRTLERYHSENGRYPRGYEELNELLPADEYPLADYDIVNYVSQGRAYGLTIRSKTNPDNVLSVQKTGLLE